MNKLMIAVLGLSLLVPVASFAQATGGSTGGKPGKVLESEGAGKKGKTQTHARKGHKGGKKSTKGTAPTTTNTPPPK